jgi:hypothetical protein
MGTVVRTADYQPVRWKQAILLGYLLDNLNFVNIKLTLG